MTKNYFKKGLSLYFLGNFSSKVISLLLLPLFTYYLTQEQYGLFDILNTVVLFLVPIVGAQIFEGIIRYLLDTDSSSERSKVISTSFIFLLVNVVLVNLIFFAVENFLEIPFIGWLLAYFNFFIINFYLQRVARGLKYQKQFALSGVINTFTIAILSIILLVVYNFKTEGLLIAYAGGAFASMIYLLLRISLPKKIKISFFDSKLLKKLLVYSIPLLFDAIIWWTMNLSDRLILGYFKGTDDVGIYGISNRFAALLTFLNHIFYLVWQEYAIIKSKEENDKKEFSIIFLQYLRIQFTGVILMMPAVKLFINYFIDPKFASAYLFVPPLLFGAMFSSFAAFYGLFYQIEEKTKGALFTSLIAGMLNLALNFILIPVYGIWAAALTTLLSFVVLWIIRTIRFKTTIPFAEKAFSYSSFGIIVSLISVFIYYQNLLVLDFIYLVVAGGLFIFINKEIIQKFLRTN